MREEISNAAKSTIHFTHIKTIKHLRITHNFYRPVILFGMCAFFILHPFCPTHSHLLCVRQNNIMKDVCHINSGWRGAIILRKEAMPLEQTNCGEAEAKTYSLTTVMLSYILYTSHTCAQCTHMGPGCDHNFISFHSTHFFPTRLESYPVIRRCFIFSFFATCTKFTTICCIIKYFYCTTTPYCCNICDIILFYIYFFEINIHAHMEMS